MCNFAQVFNYFCLFCLFLNIFCPFLKNHTHVRTFQNRPRIMKCFIFGTIYKIAVFWKSNCCICGNMRKLLLFGTLIVTVVGISKNLPHFYWKCCISWEIYKFVTFSINYVKLKLFFNLLFKSQFIVTNVMLSLDFFNLLITF